jgi:hypothetical protein
MDGIRDEEETGISGVTVVLYDCADNVVADAVSDDGCFYALSGLEEGDYQLSLSCQTGKIRSMIITMESPVPVIVTWRKYLADLCRAIDKTDYPTG